MQSCFLAALTASCVTSAGGTQLMRKIPGTGASAPSENVSSHVDEDVLLLAPPQASWASSASSWSSWASSWVSWGSTISHTVPPRVKIVTGGDAESVAMSSRTITNQKSFADIHAYAHEVHVGNYASPWIAYWHKIDVLLAELQQPNPPDVVVWMDLDFLITKPFDNMLERILVRNPGKAVILTEDALRGEKSDGDDPVQRLVNTGVMLVRQGSDALRVLEQLFEYGRQYRCAAYEPQDTGTLHEQDAFNWLLGGRRKHVWRRHVAVIPQRSGSVNLNTFVRSHYDARYHDPVESEWDASDFSAHCTGLRQQQREWCIDDAAAVAEEELARAEAQKRAIAHNLTQYSSRSATSYGFELETLPLDGDIFAKAFHSDLLAPIFQKNARSSYFTFL